MFQGMFVQVTVTGDEEKENWDIIYLSKGQHESQSKTKI